MSKQKFLLSKSSFIKGLQCLKYLYLYKYHYKLKDPIPAARKALYDRGIAIGKLAWGLFPDGVDASPPSPFHYDKSVLITKYYIEKDNPIIYEAAFTYNQVICALDILVRMNDQWIAYEVKSSARLTETYIRDAALQYYVISKSGLILNDFKIAYINKEYVRNGELNLQKLFSFKSVLKEVQKMQKMIEDEIKKQKRILSYKDIPDIEPGIHCFSPYNCEFIGNCWKNMSNQSVFKLCEMSREEQFELFQKGIKMAIDIPENIHLTDRQKIQIKAEKTGKPVFNKVYISDFLSKLTYPLFFVDFEVCSFAVPLWNYTKPFDKIPFLFSLHKIGHNNTEPEHNFFLSNDGATSQGEFILQFLKLTTGTGDILAFDMQNELSNLHRLAVMFPNLKNEIDNRISRFKDLRLIFSNNQYYTQEMNGSLSLKSIYNALNKKRTYEKLTVSNGLEAVLAYEKYLECKDEKTKNQLKDNLVKYCCTDTYAMVQIIKVLKQLTSDG